ncbi:MAG: hypothetical protein ACP5RZ_00980 [Thermoplasmata archaeon]
MKNIYTYIYLGLIAILASILRLIPSFNYYVWGVDFGIYYSILKSLSIQNLIYRPMNSIWGTSGYGYFPVPYILMEGFHYITGLNIHFIMMHFPQVFSSLTVMGIFVISKKLTGSNTVSLLSSLIVAINPFDVFEESMVGLLNFGHVFLIFSIMFLFLYIKYKKISYIYFSFISAILLMLSHHFSTLMFIISLSSIAVYFKMKNNKDKVLLYYTIVYSMAVFSYWIFFVPSMKSFLQQGLFGIPYYIVPFLFMGIFLLLYHNFENIFRIIKNASYILKKGNGLFDNLNLYIYFLTVSVVIEGLLLYGINGIRINLDVFIFSVPFLFIISFSGIGFRNIRKYEHSFFINIWIVSLTLVFLFSLATWNGILIPYRFLEYIFEPMGIVSSIGIYESYKIMNKKFRNNLNAKIVRIYRDSPGMHGINLNYGGMYFRLYNPNTSNSSSRILLKFDRVNLIPLFISILVIIFFFTTITVYPIVNQVNETSQNYITPVMMSGLDWIIKNGNENYSVATDAVDGLYLESYGFNSTFEYTYNLWLSTNWTSTINELEGNNTYPKIGYVLINSNMFNNGIYGYELSTHPSYDPPIYLNNTTFDKFFSPPFYVMYYNSSLDHTQWVYVFGVNWTYIQNYVKRND